MLGVELDERRQRYHLAGNRRLDVDPRQRLRIGLQRRGKLEDHMISVELGEILRHLALSEGIIQRLVDQRRLDSKARGLVAIDGHRQHGAAGLLIGRHIAQHR